MRLATLPALLAPFLLAPSLLATARTAHATEAGAVNDYPTTARADYVFACMTVNGGTQDALNRCSCAIDVIATVLPYHDYEEADTVLRMRQLGGGYLAQTFRIQQSNQMVEQLQEAQAEAEIRCF
jgi:hypothetical protein